MRQRMTLDALPLLTTISPLIGAATVAVMSRWNASVVRSMALSNSTMTLLLTIAAVWWLPRPASSDPAPRSFQSSRIHWLAHTTANPANTVDLSRGRRIADFQSSETDLLQGIRVDLASDWNGWSAWSALALSLTVWSALCCGGREDEATFAAISQGIMICQGLLLAAFFASDSIASLVFLEMAAIPISLLIGRFGNETRREAAGKFWIWHLVGCTFSLTGVTLLAVSRPWMQIDLVPTRGAVQFETTLLAENLRQLLGRSESAWHLWNHVAPWAAALLLLGLLIRLPVFPFQGWYLTTVAAAPPVVSCVVVVAFPLAALGDWLRLGMPLFGISSSAAAGVLGVLSLIGALQSGLAIRSHNDLKQRLAMASSATLCLAAAGLSFPNRDAVRGVCILVLCLGLVTAGGLLLTQYVESFYKTRDLRFCSGITGRHPRLAAGLSVCLLSGAGIPILFGFAGLTLQWGAASTRLWMLAGQSMAIALIAAGAIEAFALLVGTQSDVARPATQEVLPTGPDLRNFELVALAMMFVMPVLMNSAPRVLARDCERAFPLVFLRANDRANSDSGSESR